MTVSVFFSYIRLSVFLACTLVGIQVPAFVDQYGKGLQSHLAESRLALNEFQDDADRFFGGSLERLIAHYRETNDQVFTAGGQSIDSLYQRNQRLSAKYRDFRHSAWAAYTQVMFDPVPEIRQQAWNNHTYVVRLAPEALAFGLASGLVITLFLEGLLRLLLRPFRRRRTNLGRI